MMAPTMAPRGPATAGLQVTLHPKPTDCASWVNPKRRALPAAAPMTTLPTRWERRRLQIRVAYIGFVAPARTVSTRVSTVKDFLLGDEGMA